MKNRQIHKPLLKYLDKSDIESLGWVLAADELSGYWMYFNLGNHHLILNLNTEVPEIQIDNGKTYSDNKIYFVGTIKNKSELSRIMKILNINQ